MKIQSLSVKNIGRIGNFSISPDGKSVTIKAPNGAGKTTLLNSIALALSQKLGKTLIPSMVKQGESLGVITMVFDNGLTVERQVLPDNSTKKLTVKNSDGSKVSQDNLDKLWNMVSFKLDTEIDYDVLLKQSGLDLSDINGKIADLYDKRRDAKAVLKNAEAVLKACEIPDPDWPTAEQSAADLLAMQQEKIKLEAENDKKQSEYERGLEDLGKKFHDIIGFESAKVAEIAALEKAVQDRKAELERLIADRADVSKQIASSRAPELKKWNGPEDISDQVMNVEQRNMQFRKRQAYNSAKEDSDVAAFKVNQFEKRYAATQSDLAKMIADADYGLSGLSIDPENKQVLFNGLPFAARSKAEGLLIGLEWLASRNPDMRFAITCQIEDFMDDANFERFHEKARALNIQILNEQVRSIDPAAIEIIED